MSSTDYLTIVKLFDSFIDSLDESVQDKAKSLKLLKDIYYDNIHYRLI